MKMWAWVCLSLKGLILKNECKLIFIFTRVLKSFHPQEFLVCHGCGQGEWEI